MLVLIVVVVVMVLLLRLWLGILMAWFVRHRAAAIKARESVERVAVLRQRRRQTWGGELATGHGRWRGVRSVFMVRMVVAAIALVVRMRWRIVDMKR